VIHESLFRSFGFAGRGRKYDTGTEHTQSTTSGDEVMCDDNNSTRLHDNRSSKTAWSMIYLLHAVASALAHVVRVDDKREDVSHDGVLLLQ
jgi:hypothetical protein